MRYLTLPILLILAFAGVLLFNTFSLPPAQQPGPPPAPVADGAPAVQRLAAAIRIPTISHGERERNDPAEMAAFAEFLRVSFPLMHEKLAVETLGQSLLYTWTGSDAALKPILLLAHMDVVPVEPGTESQWTHPPFSGQIADGFVWGRGALDDKGSLMAQMEAIEALLAQGLQPQRTLMLALGHDEEIGGKEGALRIADELKSRKLLFEFALDEGGAITEGIVKSVSAPVANIMSAEKGYVSFRLTAKDVGGHSSRPPRQTAVGRLARAVARIQDTPLPPRLAAPVTDMLQDLAPYLPFAQRLGIANRWLLESQIINGLAADSTTDALIRTTTAPTMFHAGIKDNVLPSEAYAVINFRVLPGDTIMDVREHIRRVIADEEIDVRVDGGFGDEASAVTRLDSESYQLMQRVVREQYPEAIVTTGLVIGATDLRNYAGLYQARYNFTPFRIRAEDLSRIHGHNERIHIADYARGIIFYRRLIEEATR